MPATSPGDEQSAAFQATVRLLAARDRTAAELEQALEKKGHPEGARRWALAEARRLGYLDEGRAGAVLARRWLQEGRPVAAVAARLVEKGLAPALAEAVAASEAEAAGHSDEAAARRLLAARRLAGPRGARLLASRGFSEDLIGRLLGLEAGGP